MREQERGWARRRLEDDMGWFVKARRAKAKRRGWLRDVRRALGIPVAELTQQLGVTRINWMRMEAREQTGRILLLNMERMAEAMGCEVIYALIPKKAETMAALHEQRLWLARMRNDAEFRKQYEERERWLRQQLGMK